jgi:hypothetical protein
MRARKQALNQIRQPISRCHAPGLESEMAGARLVALRKPTQRRRLNPKGRHTLSGGAQVQPGETDLVPRQQIRIIHKASVVLFGFVV